MSKITNDGLTRSGTGCFIAVPISQQWASKGSDTDANQHTVPRFSYNELTNLVHDVKWLNVYSRRSYSFVYRNTGCQSAPPAQPAPRPRQLVQPVPQPATDPVSLKPPAVLIDPPAGDHTYRKKLSPATSPSGSRPVTPDAPVRTTRHQMKYTHRRCRRGYIGVSKS